MTVLRFVIPSVLVLAGVGCVSPTPIRQDSSIMAVEAQDATAVIEGCGHQPISGYAYCRKREGSPTTQTLAFIVPPVDCNSPESCVSIKLFRNNSDIAIGLNIPKGQTRATVAWKEILGRDHFALGDRGFWPFLYQIKYKDEKGLDRSLVTEGEIRLRVYSKDYLPLHESLDDPAFQWEFIDGGAKIKMTTSGRTYVAPTVPRRVSPQLPSILGNEK